MAERSLLPEDPGAATGIALGIAAGILVLCFLSFRALEVYVIEPSFRTGRPAGSIPGQQRYRVETRNPDGTTTVTYQTSSIAPFGDSVTAVGY